MALTQSEETAVRRLLGRVGRDGFAGAALMGGWPAPPQVTALPAASLDYLYRLVTLTDPAGADDHTYQCLRVASVPTWVQLDN